MLEALGRTGCPKAPLPTTAIPLARISLAGDRSLSSPCPVRGPVPLPPHSPKHPSQGSKREPPPRGPARQWKMIRTEWQNQYLVRPRGDYRFFSHDIRVSCTSCFSRALETQVPPRPRVAGLWLCNICTSQEVHVWSPKPMLIHLSGSRDMLAQGLLSKPGGSGTVGDAEGNVTGSMQQSTTWRCCQVLPLPSSSQPCGYIKVLASNFSFNSPTSIFSSLSCCLSLSQKS